MSPSAPTNSARRPRPFAARVTSVLFAAATLSLVACGRAPNTGSDAQSPAAAQTYTLGTDAAHPEVELRLSADRSQMTVADRLTLKLTIDSGDEASVAWTPPEPPSGRLGDFTVAAHAQRQLAAPPHRTITEHTLVLEPFLDGKKTIPPVTLDIRSSAGNTPTRTISTQPIEVTVTPVIPPDQLEHATLAPDHDPLAPTLAPHRGSVLVAAAAIAAALTWLGAFAWARLVAPRRTVVLNPLAAARVRLADLRKRLAAAQADPFAAGVPATPAIAADLAATIRTYLDQHLHVAAAGATAAELGPRLAESAAMPLPLAASTLAAITALEQFAFSPAQPRSSDLLPLLDTADQLVAATAERSPQPREAAT